MKNRIKITALLLGAVMSASLAACGSPGGQKAAAGEAESGAAAENTDREADAAGTETADEEIVLNYYEHSDNETIARQQADAYMASHPGVRVNVSIIANDDYDDKTKVMLAGDADIDVLWVRSGNIRQMGADGALLDLSGLIKANDVDYSVYGEMGNTCKDGESIYGMCGKKTCWLLWYNKDLFEAAGEEIPTDITWDEYADLCKRLTTDELRGGLTVNWSYLIGAQTEGEYLTDEELPYTRRYAEFLHRIWVEDESNWTLEEMSGSFSVSGVFAEGNTYTMINGDWNFLLFPGYNPEFEFGAVPLPHFENQEANASMGSVDAYCINSKCKNPEAAFDFIKFISYTDEGAKILAENATVAAYPSEEASEIYKQSVTTPGVEYVFSAKCYPEDGTDTHYREIVDSYNVQVQEYLLGNCTYDECMDNFLKKREEIMAK